jgi:hypothetical protein
VNTQYILVLAVIVFMGWFAFGVIYNLRRGDKLLKWMQGGLSSIGRRTTFRWMGTSVAELVIAQAKKPFRRLETLLVLKPRDVFWLTIQAYIQGRNDFLIFRAHLTTPPRLDLELVDPKTWSGRNMLGQVLGRNWESRDYQGMQLWAPRGYLELASSTLDRLAVQRETLSPRYARLSLRREAPNLELHLPFPDHRTLNADQYFAALRDLASAISEGD